MVLQELGAKLSAALSRIQRSDAIDDETIKELMKEIATALMQADVNILLVKQLRENVTARIKAADDGAALNKARIIERAVVEELTRMLDPGKEVFKPRKGKPNVVMFVGLQGAGKTTTVAKYAHFYQSRRWKVAMVCADTFRAGAFDQLKQNATRVRVPFYGSYTESDPVKIAAEGVEQFRREGYEMIIVDTSGRHKQEAALFEEMVQVSNAVKPDDIVFVMDSTIGQAAQGQAKAFKDAVPVGSVIMTKLDGHAKGGGALSAVAATGSPIIFLGAGEHFDDLQPFEASGFISKMLGRGDLRGLAEEIKDKGILEDQEAMMERMMKGKFTLRDMREQFESVLKLGPLSKVMDMMPGGLGQLMGQMGGAPGAPGADANARFRRFMVIMDSMTPDELDCVKPLDESRARRIARGSGVPIPEIQAMLMAHSQMEKTLTGLGKTGLLKGGDAALMTKMKRNPAAVMAQLQRGMDPRMLKQMGGAGNMMDMLKAMGPGGPGGGAAGGGGDMAKRMQEMMKSMGMG